MSSADDVESQVTLTDAAALGSEAAVPDIEDEGMVAAEQAGDTEPQEPGSSGDEDLSE